MSRTPRRLRRGHRPRPGIPFVVRFTDRKTLSADDGAAVREIVREAARRGDPLIVGKNIEVVDLRRPR